MKRIRIGETERDLDGAPPNWIREHVDDLRRQGKPVCVEIKLRFGSVDMILATAACGGGRGTKEANRQEKKIYDLWIRKGLNEDDFDVRELIEFAERLDIL
jgi:hypothetical protein